MKIGFAILGMMMFLLLGLGVGATIVYYFKQKSSNDDLEWHNPPHVGINIPKEAPSASRIDQAPSASSRTYENEDYDDDTEDKRMRQETTREPEPLSARGNPRS